MQILDAKEGWGLGRENRKDFREVSDEHPSAACGISNPIDLIEQAPAQGAGGLNQSDTAEFVRELEEHTARSFCVARECRGADYARVVANMIDDLSEQPGLADAGLTGEEK
jgi:hypothetical protein